MIQYKKTLIFSNIIILNKNEWQFLVEMQNTLVYFDFTDTEYDINNCFCLVYYYS